MITSSVPREGKTVVASNLAVAFAQSGRKVILVDADLRRPNIHEMFGLRNDRGLTDMVRSEEIRFEQVANQTEVPGLLVVTSGTPPANPAELLGSQRMQRVLERLQESAEIIVIDTAPVGAVTDAARPRGRGRRDHLRDPGPAHLGAGRHPRARGAREGPRPRDRRGPQRPAGPRRRRHDLLQLRRHGGGADRGGDADPRDTVAAGRQLMRRRALITGITGQDGSYLAELLLDKGYEVHGLIRRSSSLLTGRIDHLYRDPHEAGRPALPPLRATCPTRRRSSTTSTGSSPTRSTTSAPRATSRSASRCPSSPPTPPAMGTLRLLEAIRTRRLADPLLPGRQQRDVRQGRGDARRRETTPFYPRSPYAVAKVFAHWMTVQYREAYGLFASQRHPLQPRVAAARRRRS